MRTIEDVFTVPEPAPFVLDTLRLLQLPTQLMRQVNRLDGRPVYQITLPAGGELEIEEDGENSLVILRAGDMSHNDAAAEHDDVLRLMLRAWPGIDGPANHSKSDASNERLVTKDVKDRANIFRTIKVANPHLSYQGVATRANRDHSVALGKHIQKHDVRNAYRAMGWAWERADKIR